MPDEPRSSEGPERSSGSVNPEDRPLEISPEALERLRTAVVPGEFFKVAKRFVSGKLMVPYGDAEVARVPSGVVDAGTAEAIAEGPGWPETETPITTQPGAIESEVPSIEVPPTEEPPWTQEETPWSEALPPPEIEDIEWPEIPEKEPEIGTFTLTELTFDLSAVAHPTPGLLDWEEVPLERVVTDTYPVCFDEEEDRVFEEEPGGEGEEIGEEPPCIYCKLLLIFGPSERYNASTGDFEPIDAALDAAHKAARAYYEPKQKSKECIRVIHKGWRIGRIGEQVPVHRYPGPEGKWQGGDTSAVKRWVNAIDPDAGDREGAKIDCFSEALAIYHGETWQNTINVLDWLAENCKAPIRNLYLWSCWGSEKIDLADERVKKALRGVEDLTGKRISNLNKKAEELEKELKRLEKQGNPDKLEETKQELTEVNKHLLKKCDCELCLYTAAPLDKATAQARLQKEIDRLKQKRREAKDKAAVAAADREVKAAKRVLEAVGKDFYAMPLGIREPETGAPLVLLAPETKMRVYCPLNLDDPKPTEPDPEIKKIFGDVPIEPDTDLIVKGLLR